MQDNTNSPNRFRPRRRRGGGGQNCGSAAPLTIFPISSKSLILFEIEDSRFCYSASRRQNRNKFFIPLLAELRASLGLAANSSNRQFHFSSILNIVLVSIESSSIVVASAYPINLNGTKSINSFKFVKNSVPYFC